MKVVACVLALFLVVPDGRAQRTPDCGRIITTAEMQRDGWNGFHNGQVTNIDLAKGVLIMKYDNKLQTLYITDATEVCNAGKPGSLRDLKVGDKIGGATKQTGGGRTWAAVLGFGQYLYPNGIPVPGQRDKVLSPYAPTSAPISTSNVPHGALMKCPYTGKVFRNL